MIGQVQKPRDEILAMLDGKQKLVLCGCGGCATVFLSKGKGEFCGMSKKMYEK